MGTNQWDPDFSFHAAAEEARFHAVAEGKPWTRPLLKTPCGDEQAPAQATPPRLGTASPSNSRAGFCRIALRPPELNGSPTAPRELSDSACVHCACSIDG